MCVGGRGAARGQHRLHAGKQEESNMSGLNPDFPCVGIILGSDTCTTYMRPEKHDRDAVIYI